MSQARKPKPRTPVILQGDAALPHLSGNYCSDLANVRCPSCNSDYVNVKHAGTLLGTDPNEAKILSGTEITGSTPSRRSALEIVFRCEGCPHLFAVVFQEYKGQAYIEIHKRVKIRKG